MYYVLDVTDLSPRNVCEFHRQCDARREKHLQEENTQKHLKRSITSKVTPQITAREGRKDRRNLLRIAHVSDIHFDHLYDEVIVLIVFELRVYTTCTCIMTT